MIDKDFLHCIITAYQLEKPQAIEQVYNGTNRVYRLDFASDVVYPRLAVKISHTRNAYDIVRKHAVASILDQLRPLFPQLPQTLEPVSEPPQTKRHAWGLQWQQDHLITVYPWILHKPFSGLAQQLQHTGKCFVQLQRALKNIDHSELNIFNQQQTQQRLRIRHKRFELDDNFRLTLFRNFIAKQTRCSKPFAMINKHFTFLDSELELLHLMTREYSSLFDVKWLSPVHLELSPPNFGFNPDHGVAVVFDFDSLSLGHPLQDIAWLAATFCVDDRKTLVQVVNDLRVLFQAMKSHLGTYIGWQDVILQFMRLGYLDSIFRKLQRAHDGVDMRMGFLREDILCLRWLRQHNDQLASEVAQV